VTVSAISNVLGDFADISNSAGRGGMPAGLKMALFPAAQDLVQLLAPGHDAMPEPLMEESAHDRVFVQKMRGPETTSAFAFQQVRTGGTCELGEGRGAGLSPGSFQTVVQ